MAVDEPDLSSVGVVQAERLAACLGGNTYDYFYCSPLARARQTADAFGRPYKVLSWLAEYRTPALEGTPTEQVREFLETVRRRPLDEWWEGIPGGESFRHFQERIAGGVEPLLTVDHRASVHAHEGSSWRTWRVPEEVQRILIVAHGGTLSVLISHLLGIEPVPWAWERFPLSWAGYAVLRSVTLGDASVWGLKTFNAVEHLAGLEIPPY